jgi:hypothetical protein
MVAEKSRFAPVRNVTRPGAGYRPKKLYSSGEYTISGVIAQRFGRSTELVVSLVMIYALLMVNVGNYVSGAASLTTILKVNLPTAAFIIAIVSTFYFALGGFKSVAYVSMVHCTIKYIGVFVVLGVALYMTKGVAPIAAYLAAVLFHMGRPYRPVYHRRLLHRQYRRDLFDPIYHSGSRIDQKPKRGAQFDLPGTRFGNISGLSALNAANRYRCRYVPIS